MKTIVNKVMLVGRATVFTVGLAVTLALMLGVATAALAAVPGDPLKLGQANAINALTRLVGFSNQALLRIDNNSAEPSATALDLQVEAGKRPLTVNPEAGTATNLSADELDGKGSSAFFSGKTYKVTDDTLGPGGNVLVLRSAFCDSGDKVMGGGGASPSNADPLVSSQPIGEGWRVVIEDRGFPDEVSATAICADFPPLR